MRIFNAYGALLCALTERKTERELARARISVVSSQQHDKQQQVREERTCLVDVQVWTLCVVYMAMARGAYFFGILKVGIHVHFLKASADFRKPTVRGGHPGPKWRVVYMIYGELYAFCTHKCNIDLVQGQYRAEYLPSRLQYARTHTINVILTEYKGNTGLNTCPHCFAGILP